MAFATADIADHFAELSHRGLSRSRTVHAREKHVHGSFTFTLE